MAETQTEVRGASGDFYYLVTYDGSELIGQEFGANGNAITAVVPLSNTPVVSSNIAAASNGDLEVSYSTAMGTYFARYSKIDLSRTQFLNIDGPGSGNSAITTFADGN